MLIRPSRVIVLGVISAALAVPIAALRVSAQAKLPPVDLPQNPAIGQLSIGNATVPIYGVSLDVQNPFLDAGGGTGSGKATLSDISVQKMADVLSTQLFQYALEAQHVAEVRIELYNAATATVASTFVLQNVLVTGFATGGAASGESVKFHYERLQFGTGGNPFCWDIQQNKAC